MHIFPKDLSTKYKELRRESSEPLQLPRQSETTRARKLTPSKGQKQKPTGPGQPKRKHTCWASQSQRQCNSFFFFLFFFGNATWLGTHNLKVALWATSTVPQALYINHLLLAKITNLHGESKHYLCTISIRTSRPSSCALSIRDLSSSGVPKRLLGAKKLVTWYLQNNYKTSHKIKYNSNTCLKGNKEKRKSISHQMM